MNKTIIGIIIAVVVIVGGIYLVTRSANAPGAPSVSSNTAQQNQTAGPQGRVVFSMTDAALDMGNVVGINLAVTSIDVHNSVNGWTNVSTTPRTYDLLVLNATNQTALLADTSIQAGTYDQVRLTIDSVTIKMKDGTTKLAKLPSGVLKLHTTLVVNADKTSNINFDFLADKSLHLTGNGTYIFTPVIKTKVKGDAKVEIDASNRVSVTDGKDEGENNEGMDVNGEFKPNFQINDNQKLNIDSNNNIKVEDNQNSKAPETSNISIKNFSFDPATLSVKTGTKVTWTNNDSTSHTITSDSGSLLNSGTLAPGQSFSFTFTKDGTISYHCSIHPTMKGGVTVKE
jgi:plastocyanin